MGQVIVADEPGSSLIRRAYAGARRAALPGFGIGALVGVVTAIPVLMTAGAGALVGLTIGAAVAIARGR